MSETEQPPDPPEQFLRAVQRGEYASAPGADAAELVESFNRWTPPPSTAALQEAERAGFLRGLLAAAAVCRNDAACERYKSCCYRALRDAWEEIEALDGQDGADVREHCAQFAWATEPAAGGRGG